MTLAGSPLSVAAPVEVDRARPPHRESSGGRVLLATLFGAPFESGAAALAVDVAVENGLALAVINAVELAPPAHRGWRGDFGDRPAVAGELRAPALVAASLGVHVEYLRLCSPRPVAALLEVIREPQTRLVVLGSDPARASLRSRRLRRAIRVLGTGTNCLLWTPWPSERRP